MSPHAVDTNGAAPELWITGLGSQYALHSLKPEDLDEFASRFYDVRSPGLQKLLQINHKTGIQTRSSVSTYEPGSFAAQTSPPDIIDLDQNFRRVGVELTLQACRKALLEWGGDKHHLTHTIAVTCTNQGNPGYDLLVHQALGLSPSLERILLHGVGCAGGLAIMRAAAQMAAGATARGRAARILAFACEICTPNVRSELAAAEKSSAEDVGVAGALFSDGAAAFVLCNRLGLAGEVTTRPLFQVLEWETATIPGTSEYMTFYSDPYGFRTVLSRDIPHCTKQAVKTMFARLVHHDSASIDQDTPTCKSDYDWALHPGGKAIINGIQDMMGLTEHQLRATREIYRTKGNCSSPAVLTVLDGLRSMGTGREHIVATSFGPGMSIEMVLLRRL